MIIFRIEYRSLRFIYTCTYIYYHCSKVIDTRTGLMHQYYYHIKQSLARHVQNQSQSVEHNVVQRNICAAFH